jgi:RNA polymerase sigma-70 factor (ECF subfamily)
VNVALFRLTEPPSDLELIERTLGGDSNAFGALVERFQRAIYRVAFSIVRDESEADVVTQDTFVQAYTHLRKFQRRSEFGTWLTRIAINRSRDSLRRKRFISLFVTTDDGEERPVLEPVDERADPERSVMVSQLRTAIERAERKLSPQQKVMFRLRHYDGMSVDEIAAHLGLRGGTVRAQLFRAAQKIRAELAAWRTQSGR